MIRTTLIEAAQVLVRGTIGKKGKKVKSKQKDQDVKVIDYADKAVIRLQKKYHRMILEELKEISQLQQSQESLHVCMGNRDWSYLIIIFINISSLKERK